MSYSYTELKKISEILLGNLEDTSVSGSRLFSPNHIENSNVPLLESKLLGTKSSNVIQAINELLFEIRSVDESFAKTSNMTLEFLGDFLLNPLIKEEIEKIDTSLSKAFLRLAKEFYGESLQEDLGGNVRSILGLPLPTLADVGSVLMVFNDLGTLKYQLVESAEDSTPSTVVVRDSSGSIKGSSIISSTIVSNPGGNLLLSNSSGAGILISDSNTSTVTNDLIVGGDLLVQGSTTTIETTELLVEDSTIELNKDAIGPARSGITVRVGQGASDLENLFWDPVNGWSVSSGDIDTESPVKILLENSSGLNAETLDGQNGSYYLNSENINYLNLSDPSITSIKLGMDVALSNIYSPVSNVTWVSPSGDDNNDGSYFFPFKTIQTAINNTADNGLVSLFPGSYIENVFINRNNISISSLGPLQSTNLSGKITISGSSNIHLKGLSIFNTGNTCIDIVGSSGSIIENCIISRLDGSSNNAISVSGSISSVANYLLYCSVYGFLDNTATVTTGNLTVHVKGVDGDLRVRQNTLGFSMTLVDITEMGEIIHSNGILFVNNVGRINKNTTTGIGITSTASGVGSRLIVKNSSMLQREGDFARISKTGDCHYFFGSFSRSILDAVVTGVQVDHSALVNDISTDFTPVNYSNSSVSLLSHLQGIDTALGSLGGINSTLQSLSSFNSDGIMVQTAPDTFTSRSIIGDPTKIIISNSDGVSGNPTITLGGQVVTLDDTQNLTNKNITGVFTGNLTGNSDTSTKLQVSRSIALSGDVSGSAFFDGSSDINIACTVSDNSHVHDTLYYTQTYLDNNFLSKTSSSDQSVVGKVTFNGDLVVSGTSSFGIIDSGTWNGGVIGVAYGGTGSNNGSIIGTGPLSISAGGTDNSVNISGTGTGKIVFGSNVVPSGSLDIGTVSQKLNNIYAVTFRGDLDGNAFSASTLDTSRSISLSGDVTGSVSFNGSSDVDIVCTVTNDSHTHDSLYYTKTYLDNNMLSRTIVTDQSVAGKVIFNSGAVGSSFQITGGSVLKDTLGFFEIKKANGTDYNTVRALSFVSLTTTAAPLIVSSSSLVTNLNSDLLDSQQGSYYLDPTNFGYTNANLSGVTNVSEALDSLALGGGGSSGDLKSDGSVPLVNNWDVGSYSILATSFKSRSGSDVGLYETTNKGLTIKNSTGNGIFSSTVEAVRFISTVGVGTPPFAVSSTTMVPNLYSQKSRELDKTVQLSGDVSGTIDLRSVGDQNISITSNIQPVQYYLTVDLTSFTTYMELPHTPVNSNHVRVTDLVGVIQKNADAMNDSNVYPANFKVVGNRIYFKNDAGAGVSEINTVNEIPEGTELAVEYLYNNA